MPKHIGIQYRNTFLLGIDWGCSMSTKIEIWLVGNTGLRNPNRIQDGFAIFANSPYVGNLRGRDNEIGFMRLWMKKESSKMKMVKMSPEVTHESGA